MRLVTEISGQSLAIFLNLSARDALSRPTELHDLFFQNCNILGSVQNKSCNRLLAFPNWNDLLAIPKSLMATPGPVIDQTFLNETE